MWLIVLLLLGLESRTLQGLGLERWVDVGNERETRGDEQKDKETLI